MTTTLEMFDLGGGVASQKLIGLTFTRSSGSGDSSFIRLTGTAPYIIKDCILDCTGVTRGIEARSATTVLIDNCEIKNSDQDGIGLVASRPSTIISRCSIHNNSRHGIVLESWGSNNDCCILNNLIYNNSGVGITCSSALSDDRAHVSIIGNTIHNNSDHGITANQSSPHVKALLDLFGNSITTNGGFGVSVSTKLNKATIGLNALNNYDSNVAGATDNLDAGDGDLAIDPEYTSVAGGSQDFTPAAGSGLIDAISEKTA